MSMLSTCFGQSLKVMGKKHLFEGKIVTQDYLFCAVLKELLPMRVLSSREIPSGHRADSIFIGDFHHRLRLALNSGPASSKPSALTIRPPCRFIDDRRFSTRLALNSGLISFIPSSFPEENFSRWIFFPTFFFRKGYLLPVINLCFFKKTNYVRRGHKMIANRFRWDRSMFVKDMLWIYVTALMKY